MWIWGVLALLALLWPSHVSGPMHGVPLDSLTDAVVVSIVVPLLWAVHRRFLDTRTARALILALLAWRVVSNVAFTQDGLCVRVMPSRPYAKDADGVPHSWDVRADWRTPNPACAAIMTRSYRNLAEFPVWFFNLPPADDNQPTAEDRPPGARVTMTAQGFVSLGRAADIDVATGPDVSATLYVDGTATPRAHAAPGVHAIVIEGSMTGDRWAVIPRIDDIDLWSVTTPTVRRPSTIDRLIRPWAAWIPALLGGALVLFWTLAAARNVRARDAGLALLVVGIPWLTYVVVQSAPRAGHLTLYPAGNDYWQFQRYAYRIFMQGYWLEGGSPTFWFQPLYRWTAGLLHVVFGDSSIGEMIWDGWGVLIGAIAAFHLTRKCCGFVWGLAAAALTLIVFQFSAAHTWLGVGLSEISSAAWLYLAVIVLATNRKRPVAALAAGIFATLGFYTRLNNLLMALGIALLGMSMTVPSSDLWRPKRWAGRIEWRAVLIVVSTIGVGIVLFAWRTWHYTGIFSVFYGTQKDVLATVQTSVPWSVTAQRAIGSVMMVLTINDPARFDPIAIPLLAGAAFALLGLLGVPRLRSIPLATSSLALMSVAGALVARGAAYTGRFSVHAIPVMCAMAVCGCSALSGKTRNATAESFQ